MNKQVIQIKDICVHNVQHVDLAFPAGELVVFTGVSGSGKSSVAFDTLFVEGERRYLESLSPFMRRAIGEYTRPEVGAVSGLSPTLAIEQKSGRGGRRSTVGTVTEIYDYLRLLYARVATPHCPESGEAIVVLTKEEIVAQLQTLPEGSKIVLLAPLPLSPETKGLSYWIHRGYTRARSGGRLVDLEGEGVEGNVEVVVDRFTWSQAACARLAEGVTAALEVGEGKLLVWRPEEGREDFYATYGYAPRSQRTYPPLEVEDFSFNHPAGMCEACQGLLLQEGSCPSCHGSRLKPYPSAARLSSAGHVYGIQPLTDAPLDDFIAFFEAFACEEVASPTLRAVREELVGAILPRARILQELGLSYLSLSRPIDTLSGGEAQRVHLAAQVGSGLVGVTTILDEPSIGLHPSDNQKLIRILERLRDKGNTVVVVEHDEEMIWAADRVVDFGPGPGREGGKILVNGSHDALLAHPDSWTGKYLSGRETIPLPLERRKGSGALLLEGATHHNLKNLTLSLPLGVFVAVTGVSGSGKSSLIQDTLTPLLKEKLASKKSKKSKDLLARLEGGEGLKKLLAIDQSPLGSNPRSTPATYLKIFEEIRTLFAQLPESRAAGYTAQTFSFNTSEGGCPTCRGIGRVCVDRDFLPDQWVDCPTCRGARFTPEALSIYYKGKNIHEILSLSVTEALHFFTAPASLRKKLELLEEVGMGYISLGQPASTFSGGEAQRIKLAAALSVSPRGRTLYLLDEPTTGLHLHDIRALLKVLHALVERGESVLVIEHHMEVIKTADWVVDLGPEGGEQGGYLVGEGTPETIATLDTPTGRALRAVLEPKVRPHKRPSPTAFSAREEIRVRGAHEHNLQKVDLTLPRHATIAFTGPSGSGKSALALDTIYVEGARRYLDALTPYARQWLHPLPKPKCDSLEGLSPAIAIEKKRTASSPRSTVGTLSEAYDYLRLLFARAGSRDTPFVVDTPDSLVQKLLSSYEGEQALLLAPLVWEGAFSDLVARLQRKGYLRLSLGGTLYELDAPLPVEPLQGELALVIDTLRLTQSNEGRLRAALAAARTFGTQVLARLSHTTLRFSLAEREGPARWTPALFSFNSKEGMCPSCHGLGVVRAEEEKSSQGERCPACEGTRLLPLACQVLLQGKSIVEWSRMPISEMRPLVESLEIDPSLEEVVEGLRRRLRFLEEIGVGYLSLDRAAPTLSNGELDRVRLAKQLGGGLTDMLYVLEAPTSGLHPEDKQRLHQALAALKKGGNTLLLIEQDRETIAQADYLVELGPGAGARGGRIVSQGTYQEVVADPASVTGGYLSGRKKIEIGRRIRTERPPLFEIASASVHNIQNLSLSFPLQRLVGITGVSGSGKSTLLHEVILPIAQARIQKGSAPFERISVLDQTPIGHTARADVGTTMQLLSPLRTLYAQLASARTLGLTPAHFSYNHPKGMCMSCRGLGYQKVSMHFLPSLRVTCPSCKGRRLNPLSLSVSYQGRDFGQLLTMRVEEVEEAFPLLLGVTHLCKRLSALGLGYLSLGQEVATLSLGEGLRVKLARVLAPSTPTLYLLDEPTAGLHKEEVQQVVTLLNCLVEEGASVLLIEHSLDVIRQCDILLDLGPGAGEEGGKLVCSGTPEAVAAHPLSLTGKYLKTS